MSSKSPAQPQPQPQPPLEMNKPAAAKRRLFEVDDEENVVPVSASIGDTDVSMGTTSAAAEASPINIILETPQKPKRARILDHSFFSPSSHGGNGGGGGGGKAIVTPQQAVATSRRSSSTARLEQRKEPYVPLHIYENLGYQRKGQASLNQITKDTVNWVQAHFVIPLDLESNKSTYGPLSGSCWEERVIRAYNMTLLKPKEESNNAGVTTSICSQCATLGHKRNDCPDLV